MPNRYWKLKYSTEKPQGHVKSILKGMFIDLSVYIKWSSRELLVVAQRFREEKQTEV